MVSVSWRRKVSLRTLCEARASVKAERSPHGFIGGRRLGAWEAVVFGALHVESALAEANELACWLMEL